MVYEPTGDVPRLPDVFEPTPRQPQPVYVNRCHSIGHPCILFNWFQRVHWDHKREFGQTLLRIFHEGQRWHQRVAAAFVERGVEYIRQEEPMHWPSLQLSGHMDGVVLPGPAVQHLKAGEKAVVDVKGMSDFAFAAINTIGDLMQSHEWYHRAYLVQPTLYASHGNVNAEWVVLYKVKRSTGETGQIWWRTSDAMVEAAKAYDACRKINSAIANPIKDVNGYPIPPIDLAVNGKYCDDCDFAPICPAYRLEAKGLQLATSEVSEMVERMHELKPASTEYSKLQKAVNAHWKRVGSGDYICGDYLARVKEISAKEVPAKPATVRPAYLRTTYQQREK